MKKCPYCAEEIQDDAIKCRYCRSDLKAPDPPSTGPRATVTTSAVGEGVATGVLAGAGTAGCCFIAGILLSLTGIGAIIGIPLILVGLGALILGPFMGLGNIKGACPYCGKSVSAQKTAPGVNCPACKRRIVIKDKRFVAVE